MPDLSGNQAHRFVALMNINQNAAVAANIALIALNRNKRAVSPGADKTDKEKDQEHEKK